MTFAKVAPRHRRAKVLLLGEAGSGKTHAALTFPKPAVIDAEGSIDWFADRFDFTAVSTKSYADVRDLVHKVREGNVPCETLVIDSLTTIYNGLVNLASREREDLRPLDWGRIKRKFSSLLDELYFRLPMHVVCCGWISTEYARAGTMVDGNKVKPNDLVAIGEKFDGDKKTTHAFDFVFRINGNDGKRTSATVVKSRSGTLKAGQKIEDFSWKTLASLFADGRVAEQTGMTDEEQIARDAGVLEAPEGTKPVSSAQQQASATDAMLARAREVGVIGLDARPKMLHALRTWATAQGLEWRTTVVIEALDALVKAEQSNVAPSEPPAANAENAPLPTLDTLRRQYMAICDELEWSDGMRHAFQTTLGEGMKSSTTWTREDFVKAIALVSRKLDFKNAATPKYPEDEEERRARQ